MVFPALKQAALPALAPPYDDDHDDHDDDGDVGDDVVDGDGDVRHLVVGEWIAGKQLWLLSSIRPNQCQH